MTENSKQGAFATSTQLVGEEVFQQGLTKREYFAGLAMQGILANSDYAKTLNIDDYEDFNTRVLDHSIEIADGLLKRLEL